MVPGVLLTSTVVTGLVVLLLLSVSFMFGETLDESNRSEGNVFAVIKTFGDLFRDKVFMGIAFTQALIMTAMFAYIAGSPFVLQNIYGVSPQQFSLIFAMNGLGIIVAAQAAGRLSSFMHEVRILLMGVLMSVTGSVVLVVVVLLELSLLPMLIALILVASSVGLVTTTAFSLGMQNQKKSAGSASAFLGLLPFIGGAVVSPIVGMAGDEAAWPLGLVTILCSMAALIIFLGFVKQQPAID